MPGCSVPDCHRRANQGYRLFVFPKKPVRRKLWTQLCNRENKPPPAHARICEYHFDDNQFEKDLLGRKGKLKSNAVPTIFDAPLNRGKVLVSLKSKKNGTSEDIITNPTFEDIEPEFVDVSQHDDDSFWKADLNVDTLHVEENSDVKEKDFECGEENSESSNDSLEKLCVEPEIRDDKEDNIIESDDIFKSLNKNVQTIISRTKDLEEQLKKKDKKLVKIQRRLSKTLKQVDRLKTLNENLQTKISELSGKRNSDKYSARRKRIKSTKFSD